MISPAAFLNGGLRVLTRSTQKPAVVIVFADMPLAILLPGALEVILALTVSPLRLC